VVDINRRIALGLAAAASVSAVAPGAVAQVVAMVQPNDLVMMDAAALAGVIH
jgi:hypothetical protein